MFPSRTLRRLACTCVLALGCCVLGRAGEPVTIPPFAFALDGSSTNILGHGKTLALIFVSTHCPVANSYAPEIRRIAERFAALGIVFHLVYPDPDDTAAKIREHLRDYALPLAALRDPKHTLANFAGARVTPEVAVFSNNDVLLYRGRIDDRVVALGKTRAAAPTHDLENTLVEILAGRAPTQTVTRAIGCYIGDLK